MSGLFGDSISREAHELIVASVRSESAAKDRLIASMEHQLAVALTARERADERYAALVAEVMELKRHDIGALPKGAFDASLSATDGLGEKTRMAIDMACDGYPDLRLHQTAQAQLLWGQLKADTDDVDELDARVADLILQGDTT
jgi:hypothetical protein